MKKFASAFFGLAAAVVGLAAADGASASTKTEKTFGSWTAVCVEKDDNSKGCSIIQSRVSSDKKRMVLVWSITMAADKKLTQAMTVPVPVSVKEGVRLFIGDTTPLPIGFDVCGPRACLGGAPLDAAFLGTVRSATKASASYVLANKQLVQIQLDLTGFSDAYDYLVQQMS